VAADRFERAVRGATELVNRFAHGERDARQSLPHDAELSPLHREIERTARAADRELAEVREERDRLRGILFGMQEGLLLLDASGRIALVNPAVKEMLLLGADAVGKTLLEAIRHTELKQLLDDARVQTEPLSREIEVGGLRPRRLLVRVTRAPFEDSQVFAVFSDVTEIRRLESMRRDFAANVSHELRTPITAIRSAAETLQFGPADDRQFVAQFLGIIDRNAGRLQDLVEDVLSLSHIESQKLKLCMEPLDLGGIGGQVLGIFRERAAKKQLELDAQLEASLRVAADRRALEHVLTNLVDNAVKYCSAGAKIQVSASAPDADWVRVLVNDSGPGIEARHLPRVFERFYRVDAGRSRELGGTGLGLSIVKHLVEAMGGQVSVESTPGVGTTFSFTLRRANAEVSKAVA